MFQETGEDENNLKNLILERMFTENISHPIWSLDDGLDVHVSN